jgi:hypothetical protein
VLGVVDSDGLERFWGFGFGFSASEFAVFAWFSNLNLVGTGRDGASCWKPFAPATSTTTTTTTTCGGGRAGRPAGRGGGGGAMKSLLGVLNRTETFALLFDLSSKNVLLYFLGFLHFCVVVLVPKRCCCCQKSWCCWGTTTYYRRVLVI